MKEAIITDTTGLYVDVTLTSGEDYGVAPIYTTPEPDEPDADPQEPLLTGYRVAVPVTPGLFKPRFDLDAWGAWNGAGDKPALWIEGLTPEEIAALHPDPQLTDVERLQAENADLKERLGDVELALADVLSGGGV